MWQCLTLWATDSQNRECPSAADLALYPSFYFNWRTWQVIDIKNDLSVKWFCLLRFCFLCKTLTLTIWIAVMWNCLCEGSAMYRETLEKLHPSELPFQTTGVTKASHRMEMGWSMTICTRRPRESTRPKNTPKNTSIQRSQAKTSQWDYNQR